MAAPLVSDDLWALIAPLIPPKRPKPKGGRPPISHRAALTGILFVLKSGIPWEMLPAEMGCGSGMTCWRRLRVPEGDAKQHWQRAGVWQRLHHVLLDRLGRANAIDWSRAALDSARVPAKRGAKRPGPARPTAASRGASATSSAMRAASPSRSRSARRTLTTANASSA